MNCNFNPFPELTTERLLLRQITLDDDKEIFYERSDEEMNRYIHRVPAKTIDDARDVINMVNGYIAKNESVNWGITLKGQPKIIGGICFWNLAPEIDKAEIGYSLHTAHQGKGLMQEAIEAALGYCFGVMGVKTVLAYTHPENQRSIKLLLRNWFKRRENEVLPAEAEYIVFELLAGNR